MKTLDDYLALPEGSRVELIDGVFYDMADPSIPNTYFATEIFSVFKSFVKSDNNGGVAMAAPVDVQLDSDDKTVVQPDAMIIRDRSKITRPRVVGAPDLIVEVLSQSNWYHDMIRKLKKYKNTGVKEYWIVNIEEKSVIVYDFETSDFPTEYSFDDEVPVGIWDGECKVNFRNIYEEIEFVL
ncbi:MAG: Uma2 family endonuclease [Lachnospiraceae bacterium]|nr:Uma2 family endonuclease [Lachnospiraceae bacterium]